MSDNIINKRSLGINIGSSSMKAVIMGEENITWSMSVPHEGNFQTALNNILASSGVETNTQTLVTGNEGRYLFTINSLIEPLCVEEALKQLKTRVNAVVSMGGEDLIVYTVDDNNKIVNTFSGNKCASGTGEFLKQQLARMDLKLSDINQVPDDAKVLPLSARCSVFMKSDCTHRLNKSEATKNDIVLSLGNVMAWKVIDFLKKARIEEGRVVLTGGVTKNRHIVRFIKEHAPNIEFIIPDNAPVFEATGAALLAKQHGSPLPQKDKLMKANKVRYDLLDDLKKYTHRVTYFHGTEGKVEAGREYILGVDGGSTTTKACLIDMETNQIVASHYGRTHGDPVKAFKENLRHIREKIKQDLGDQTISIPLAATTGSSREILGVFLETQGVYNEIIAHSVGTTFFNQDVDTIFEIGGQDAKYVLLKNKVPIDYAMNEACSAGTGSFLEESAQGDLNIEHPWEIGDIALQADTPLKFGEHCSAFINSDIRKAIQQGATRENITGGIIASIVSNYLNRVVGSRTIGNTIFLQGGVAKNKAVPLAFAMMLNKDILVPPSPELMGCLGVGLLAKEKYQEGLLEKTAFDINTLIEQKIVYKRVFNCKSCDNYCPIQILEVNEHSYMFGGRCNKYANMRKNFKDVPVFDYIAVRQELLFNKCAPSPEDFTPHRTYTIGIPRALSVHTLYPLYAWFFHTLGIKTILSTEVEHEGVARVESTYCFPAEIAHGAVQDMINKGVDYVLVPHFRDMPSYEESVHANFCPITQGLPYYIKKAFPEIPEDVFLPLVVSFKYGNKKALEHFINFGKQLNIGPEEVRKAFQVALEKQEDFFSRLQKLGKEALEEAQKADRPVIAVLGRPYNAFTQEANMGIPRKFTSRGYSVIPFDILPYEEKEIFPNMYWYYGQQDMKAASLIKDEPNIYVTFISNFSCAPDSFLLHYLKWLMGIKPFLILELDSHSADAGIDTRVEAFLDIIEGYNLKKEDLLAQRYDNGLRFINRGRQGMFVQDTRRGEEIPVKNNKKVKILLSNMGDLSTDLLAAILQSVGYSTEALPVSTFKTLQVARAHASGKECVPSHLVLGGALEFFASEKYRKDEIYLLFVPITTGPCRTGQYYVYYENLFKDLKLENVVVFTMNADNSYTEFGSNFSKYIWYGLVIADYLKDIQTALRACAADPEKALVVYNNLWKSTISAVEKGIDHIRPTLKWLAEEVAKIPRKKEIKDCPKVLVVGEIYVRRDDFVVDELIELLCGREIVTKISGVCEWIHYLDFVREFEIKKQLDILSWYKKPFSQPAWQLLKLRLEMAWKHSVERKIKRSLQAARLIPQAPHDMREIMANTEKYFVTHELNSEIAVSSGVAATAMLDGYSGVVNISPFACLIGRVIEGIYTPWARERNFPVISLEIDGNMLPPNLISKLNIFMMNVLRLRKDRGAAELIEYGSSKTENSIHDTPAETVALECDSGGNGKGELKAACCSSDECASCGGNGKGRQIFKPSEK